MPLPDAILEIADDMDAEAEEILEEEGQSVERVRILRRYARSLRTAVKAAEGSEPPKSASPVLFPGMLGALATGQDIAEIAKAREAERRRRAEERAAGAGLGPDGQSTALCEGGPADGSSVMCPANVPKGSKTVVAGAVYVMGSDGVARFSKEETEKLAGKE